MNKRKVAIKPLAKLVLAQRDEASAQTSSGLYLPENATEKPKTATVISVGPEVKDIKAQDRIIYEEYAGTTVKLGQDNSEYILVPADKILALVV